MAKKRCFRVRRDEDLELIRRLDADVFPKGVLLDDHDLKTSAWWVVWYKGKAVGYAGAKVLGSQGLVYFVRSGVVPYARGKGMQEALIQARINWARKQPKVTSLITYTLFSNHPSSNNLIKRGFELYTPEDNWVGDDVLYWMLEL
jgi:GNAT superfamily N-acetyltransferase